MSSPDDPRPANASLRHRTQRGNAGDQRHGQDDGHEVQPPAPGFGMCSSRARHCSACESPTQHDLGPRCPSTHTLAGTDRPPGGRHDQAQGGVCRCATVGMTPAGRGAAAWVRPSRRDADGTRASHRHRRRPRPHPSGSVPYRWSPALDIGLGRGPAPHGPGTRGPLTRVETQPLLREVVEAGRGSRCLPQGYRRHQCRQRPCIGVTPVARDVLVRRPRPRRHPQRTRSRGCRGTARNATPGSPR